MEKIFYADNTAFPSSIDAVKIILSKHFGIEGVKISRSESGKPYLDGKTKLFFSVTHTKEKLFIGFCDENIGIDAELINRKIDYMPILRRFPIAERDEILSSQDFLRHWTVKESAVKWLDGTLARDLDKLSFIQGVLRYKNLELPIQITTTVFEGHILSVCSERDFSSPEFIPL